MTKVEMLTEQYRLKVTRHKCRRREGLGSLGTRLHPRMCRIRLPHIVSEARMAAFECTKNYSPLVATCNARGRIGRRGPR